MFASLPADNRRSRYTVAASFVLHLVVVALVVHVVTPLWLQPATGGGALSKMDMLKWFTSAKNPLRKSRKLWCSNPR